MKHTLVLDNPIKINGEMVSELTYDPMEITADQFATACAKSASVARSGAMTMKTKESDYALHLYLGMMSVIAVNPGIDISDLERIKGFDIIDLTNIGAFFTVRKSAVPSEQSSSEKLPVPTAGTTIQASETLEVKD